MTCQEFTASELFDEKRLAPNVERRSNRRKAAVHSFYRRRRAQARRQTDDVTGQYVDVHETRLGYLALLLMTLSIIDAFFTLVLLENGSRELNPLLEFLLQVDTSLFLGVKFFITAMGIVFFVQHKHHKLFNLISCYQLLSVSVAVYAVLIGYEFTMVRHLPF